MSTSTAITLRVIPLPAFGFVAAHCQLEHGVYVGDVTKHADLVAAHDALHRGGIPAEHAMPHLHPEMAPTPTHAPADVESCDWCGDPIAVGEPVWFHIAGLVHAWHPGERP